MTPDEVLYLCRRTDEAIATRYDQGPDGRMQTPVHLSIGHEGAAVGVCMGLPVGSHVFAGHRNHAVYLAMGGDLDAMIAELYGKATGCTEGRGGSMHLVDESVGFMGGFPIVGDAISLATGSALAAKLENSLRVTCVFFGDGAVESGQFWESLNFAATHRLRLLYVCENNRLATDTWLEARQPIMPIHERVKGFVPAFTAEVSEVFDVCENVQSALKSLPAFIEVSTHRWREHVGPNWNWNTGLEGYHQLLEAQRRDKVKDLSFPEIDRRIEEAFEKALAAPWPEVVNAL
jgi:TPP-dependent pyruvate/acetoin dehydrogenase alpha subunit